MAVRLMIVDDAEDARFLIRVILEEEDGVEIVGEADGADGALEQVGQAGPDVVLLDAVMPKIDGYELAPLLRERSPGIRLILLTAHVDGEVRARAEAAGIERVLGKEEFARIPATVIELAQAG